MNHVGNEFNIHGLIVGFPWAVPNQQDMKGQVVHPMCA